MRWDGNGLNMTYSHESRTRVLCIAIAIEAGPQCQEMVAVRFSSWLGSVWEDKREHENNKEKSSMCGGP
jgi:hypothetical protein